MRIFILVAFCCFMVCCKPNRNQYSSSNTQNFEKYEDSQEKKDLDSLIKVLPDFSLPMYSDSIIKFVHRDEGYYRIDSLFLKHNNPYTNNRLFNNKKSDKDSQVFFYEINDKTFYPLFKYQQKNYYTIGSIVKFYGENDIPGVFFLLNNFNEKGKQLDYLIIFNRFSWEINYEYNFQIDTSFKITIDILSENYYDNERDDFIKEGESPETVRGKEHYKINSIGLFEKIEHKK